MNNINNLEPEDENKQPENKSNEKKKKLFKEILEWVLVILLAIIISIVIKDFFFEHYKVDQSSMNNTLFEGDDLIVYKFGYHIAKPQRGDIIIMEHVPGRFQGALKYIIPFPNPDEVDYVKRVIGLPGETVDIIDGKVIIEKDGKEKALDEPYAITPTLPVEVKYPLIIPEGKYFVLGDNRPASKDSRTFGLVDENQIKGKVALRIWPFNKFGAISNN